MSRGIKGPLTEQEAQVLAILHEHIGNKHGISAQALAWRAGVRERQLRALVSNLRERGVGICGTPSTGYFIAETAEEVEKTCQFHRDRAMHSLHIEARLRRIPLPDLLGQLKIPT